MTGVYMYTHGECSYGYSFFWLEYPFTVFCVHPMVNHRD